MDGLLGRRLGPYRVLVRIGEGGMGVVYQAAGPDGHPVAIKVLRPHVAADPEARRRLAREVETLRRVRHPRVAEVLAADVNGPVPYLATRYVPGPPLDDFIDRNGPLDEPSLIRLGKGLGDALATIHSAGVVHRDLKPGNVLMLDGDPVVIDFGIAHAADDSRLTSTGLVMGTPGYLSPELLEGDHVTNATDWWGWAATMTFAATGRPPFGRGPLEAVLDRVRRGAVDLTGVPASLASTLAAALSADPSARPRPGALRRALDAAAAGTDTGTIALGHRPSAAPAAAPPGGTVEHPPAGAITRPEPELARPPATRAEPQVPPVAATSVLGGPIRTRVMPAEPGAPQPYPQPPAAQQPPGRGWFHRRTAGEPPAARPVTYPQQRPVEPRPGPPWQPPQVPRQGAPGPVRPLSRRSGTVFVSFLAFVALCAAAPVVGLMVGAAWSVLARTVERARHSLLLRRHNQGPRPGDVAGAVGRTPWYLVASVLGTALAVVPPATLGVCTFFAAQIAVPTTTGGAAGLVPLAAGAAVAWATAWWGPGGGGLRRGSRAVARAVTPGAPGALVAVTVCLAVLVVAGYAAATNAWEPSWYPFADAPWSLIGAWAREQWSLVA